MINRILLLIILFFQCTKEKENRIIYKLSDNITQIINCEYNKIPKKERYKYHIEFEVNERYGGKNWVKITSLLYSGANEENLKRKTNRFLKIGDNKFLPILFSTDIDYLDHEQIIFSKDTLKKVDLGHEIIINIKTGGVIAGYGCDN